MRYNSFKEEIYVKDDEYEVLFNLRDNAILYAEFIRDMHNQEPKNLSRIITELNGMIDAYQNRDSITE